MSFEISPLSQFFLSKEKIKELSFPLIFFFNFLLLPNFENGKMKTNFFDEESFFL